jgi:Mg-chelatase subunit ChlD
LVEQRRLNAAAKVSLILFNEITEVVYDGRQLAEAEDLDWGTYQPSGSTALWDGLARMVALIGTRYDAKPPERRPRVLIVTLTDGEENGSQWYTLEELRAVMDYRQKACGWQFITISPQAISLALRLGVPISNAARWEAEPEKIRLLLDRVSQSISTYRLGYTARLQLTRE